MKNRTILCYLCCLATASLLFIVYASVYYLHGIQTNQLFHHNPVKNIWNGSNFTVGIHKYTTFSRGSCDKWSLKEPILKTANPTIKLDSHRFLFPGVMFGPNNQLIEFWNAVYVAIRLNRTVVLPVFYTHHTVEGGALSANQRIDVERLCNFVSCATIREFRSNCNGSFDAIFLNHDLRSADIKRAERATGLNILHTTEKHHSNLIDSEKLILTDYDKSEGPVNIPKFPRSQNKHSNYPSDERNLRRLLNTSLSCVLYMSSFRGLKIPKETRAIYKFKDLSNVSSVSDNDLYSAVLNAVQKPHCIKEAAKLFIKVMFGDELYVGVHWRYDKQDWLIGACHKRENFQMCETISNITVQDVADGIMSTVPDDMKFIYLATPPIEAPFKTKLHTLIEHTLKNPANLLEVFLVEHFEPCWMKAGWRSKGEILSLVEMEIMQQSAVFLYSPASTWSENIKRYRDVEPGLKHNYEDRSILEVAQIEMLKRNAL